MVLVSMIVHCVFVCCVWGGGSWVEGGVGVDRHVITLQTNTHQPDLTTHSLSHLTHLPSRLFDRQLRETHHKHCIFEKQFVLRASLGVWHRNTFGNFGL